VNPEDPWDIEEWTVTQRVAVAVLLGLVPLAAATGWALFPLLLTYVVVGGIGAAGRWALQELIENV